VYGGAGGGGRRGEDYSIFNKHGALIYINIFLNFADH
jgi:hypothetical protein